MTGENDPRLRNPASEGAENTRRFQRLSSEAQGVFDRAVGLAGQRNHRWVDTNFLALALLERPEIRGAFADNLDLSRFEEELATLTEPATTVMPLYQTPSGWQMLSRFQRRTPLAEPTRPEMGATPALAHLMMGIPQYQKRTGLMEVEVADLAVLLVGAHSGNVVSLIRELKVDEQALIASLQSVRRTEKDRTRERLSGFFNSQGSAEE